MNTPHAPRAGLIARAINAVQWTVFAIVALVDIAALSNFTKLGVPGAPVHLLYTCLGATTLTAITLAPPVFRDLPGKGKLAAYAAAVGVFTVLTDNGIQFTFPPRLTPTGRQPATSPTCSICAAKRAASNTDSPK